ncbi:multifunctional conjugation protein TraI [mine drainage metagenome]|uniref:Multifunctional conjugation protein TraI n=1 Tax=mine drainage metagenome TaxID=410659 RepID=A0A1J5RGZ1_9ZZZZ
MSVHRLSAGAGYQYLLKHTASGDCDRTGATPLTVYYTETGNPPGRWLGAGLTGLAGGIGIEAGARVTQEAMANLFGAGRDPITAVVLGKAYPVFAPASERIAARVAELPDQMGAVERQGAIETITRVELAKPARSAVAGFDLTFTVQKSASTLWALGDTPTQEAVLDSHRAAVDQAIAFLEDTALFTRTGTRSCAQVPTRGLIAAAFDHWDTRTGDPNIHTHVVVANKVQGPDGAWRAVDSRALHHAVVSISEVYDNLFADELARRLPVSWGWRHRGPRRTPAFEVTGISDDLLATFSTRSTQIDQAMTTAMAQFIATHGRGPNRIETTRLRQVVTRATRPNKHVRNLADLFTAWRRRGQVATGRTPEELVAAAMTTSRVRPLTSTQVSGDVVGRLATETLEQVITRRSTWTRANVLAEAARTTRGLRMATPTDRHALHARVVDAVLERCVNLAAPELFTVPATYQRPDGTPVFSRPAEDKYTDLRVLDAETRLIAATKTTGAPVARRTAAHEVTCSPVTVAHGRGQVLLATDQADAVTAIATSGRRVDVLVGPAGTGKTTTLLALRRTWEKTHGPGSVIGLAPSATAAGELADALGVTCENTAKWIYESAGPGNVQRAALIDELTAMATGLHPRTGAAQGAHIATAVTALPAQTRTWTLHSGQLLIIDEASLAGTFTLDTLVAQATDADAKVLLVGDHAQLSAVDAGGAFGLLAEHGHPTMLTSLWRFTHRWEAHTTRLLRVGNPHALDAYAEHDRISTGPSEAMLEDAYTSWQTSEADGHTAILLAPDSHAVQALNTRAHTDRVTDHLVAPTGVTTEAGVTIGAGDRIITRRNARHLHVAGGGYVRNGDLWDVTLTHPDGSLTATQTTRNPNRADLDGAGADTARVVHLTSTYVAEHVDLGYATTTHRAQGITVDHAHVLAAPRMTRENLYVAMTRGRAVNHVYVATDLLDPMCDDLPDPHGAPAGRDVLERILATPGAELSATQTTARNLDEASSLARLEPIRQTLAADAATRHWIQTLPHCELTPTQVHAIDSSPARGPLITALRHGENAGHPMRDVLTRLVATRPLSDPNPAGDIAAVLHQQVTAWLDAQSEARHPTSAAHDHRPEPVDPADPAADAIAQIDALISGRITNLADVAIATRPGWLRPLGDLPDPGPARAAWTRQIAAIAAHYDLTGAPHEPTAPPTPTALSEPLPTNPDTTWSLTR